MIYGGMIGSLGGLEQVMFTSSEKVAFDSRTRKRTAVSGRTHVRVLPRRPRVWSCSIDHDAPQEGALLDQLEERQYRQNESLIWYPADAQGSNVLTPEASLMSPKAWEGITPSGPSVMRGDSTRPSALISGSTEADGTWAHLSMIPVPRKQVVTASVVLTPTPGETGYFWVDELRADGRTLLVNKINTREPERLSMTFETDAQTVALTFGVSRSARVTQPALTFTDRLMPWGIGRGCTSSLLEITSRDPLWTATNHPIYAAADKTEFTITEIIR